MWITRGPTEPEELNYKTTKTIKYSVSYFPPYLRLKLVLIQQDPYIKDCNDPYTRYNITALRRASAFTSSLC